MNLIEEVVLEYNVGFSRGADLCILEMRYNSRGFLVPTWRLASLEMTVEVHERGL